MIDILIPVWNRLDLTQRVIASVREHTTVPYQLMVIDDGSTDGTAEWLSLQNDICVITNSANQGFSVSVNRGLKRSTAPYVALLNNDVVVSEGWLKALVDGMGGRIGAIGPLSTAQQQFQWQGNFAGHRGVYAGVEYLAYFCVVLKREAIVKVGWLDERFSPAYGEDDDYSIRLRCANYDLAVHCDVLVEHEHGATGGHLRSQRSFLKLREKWGKKVWISVLNQGAIQAGLADLLQHITRHPLHSGHLEYPMARPIAHNRNQIVQRVLESDSDYLLMIDSDTVPTRNPMELVVMGKHIIGLPVPVWDVNTYPEFPVYINVMDARGDRYVPKILTGREGLLEVDAVGTGCMLIAREVLESVRAPFERFWDENGIQVMGLDWAFCRKAKSQGFEVWTHTSFPCEHWKTIDLSQVLSRVAVSAARFSTVGGTE